MKGIQARVDMDGYVYMEIFLPDDDRYDNHAALLKESLWTTFLIAGKRLRETHPSLGSASQVHISLNVADLP